MTSSVILALAVFGASAVEMVEALTIVLAAGVSRGWRSALEGAAAAAIVLTVLVAGVGVRACLVVRPPQAHRQCGRRLGLQAQVGQHIAHQRLVNQQLAERAADSRPHQAVAAKGRAGTGRRCGYRTGRV